MGGRVSGPMPQDARAAAAVAVAGEVAGGAILVAIGAVVPGISGLAQLMARIKVRLGAAAVPRMPFTPMLRSDSRASRVPTGTRKSCQTV